MEVRESRS
uniref:Uncharacterized protein n=1 Tax=Rhizophora mucronata TaxID=61149 RepID=A0A2P2NLN2_RHIMU